VDARPEAKGVGQITAGKTMARVLAHRVWADQRRGWRYTNPNLEELGLLRAEYLALDDLAMDAAAFAGAPSALRDAPPDIRKRALTILLDVMRRGLAVTTEVLNPATIDEIGAAKARSTLVLAVNPASWLLVVTSSEHLASEPQSMQFRYNNRGNADIFGTAIKGC
jgi:hypothetical protein